MHTADGVWRPCSSGALDKIKCVSSERENFSNQPLFNHTTHFQLSLRNSRVMCELSRFSVEVLGRSPGNDQPRIFTFGENVGDSAV